MEKLIQLLHELIDHAVPQGNKRGELHALADEVASVATEVADVTAPAVPAVPAAKLKADVPPAA